MVYTFAHTQLERVQREVHNQMYDNLPYGSLLIQMDYAENIKLVVREQRFEIIGRKTIVTSTVFFLKLFI